MFRKRKLIRIIALFFLVELLFDISFPLVSYALTSGPTAPEYTSFEPVDTTDMVNLATGDMTYNIPLLEVPGPAGGYPLSLSYHAGIQPDEDASWVGLGFTFNPGAMNRTVNGYPDDQHDVVRTVTDYWQGGERNTFSLGMGVPGASYGLQVSHDTNLGLGLGSSITLGLNRSIGSLGLGANATVGAGPFGGTYGGVGAGLSIGVTGNEAQGLTASLGVSTNFNNSSFNGGVSYSKGGYSVLGANISSQGLKPSVSVGGASISNNNNNAGQITSESSGFNIPIPVGPVSVTLGYNYLRYYSYTKDETNIIGTIYTDETTYKDPEDWSYDSYSLINISEIQDISENDPDGSDGGSYPAYDFYNVTGQGIGGSKKPTVFSNHTLFRKNVKNGDDYLIQYKF